MTDKENKKLPVRRARVVVDVNTGKFKYEEIKEEKVNEHNK